MSQLHEECGVAAIYHLPGRGVSPIAPDGDPEQVSRLLPRMLLDIQNRGQLAAGMTTYFPGRNQLIDTYKDVGTVAEVFRLNHRGKYESLMREYAGVAGIGHVRYATCGADDRSYAQPFERHHIKKHKWFSFAFNGQLANYPELRAELLKNPDNHLARETDTEIIMHTISTALAGEVRPSLPACSGQDLAEITRRAGNLWKRSYPEVKTEVFQQSEQTISQKAESGIISSVDRRSRPSEPHPCMKYPPGKSACNTTRLLPVCL